MHTINIREHSSEAIPQLQPLWEALFDHHLAIGAAGMPTIARELSWPRRRARYELLFAQHSRAALWLAQSGDTPIGYAVAFEELLPEGRTLVLETLSVAREARGHSIGSRLMDQADHFARSHGIALAALDVLAKNDAARRLYLRRGYRPRSESWMLTDPAAAGAAPPLTARVLAQLAEQARIYGFALSVTPAAQHSHPDAVIDQAAPSSTTWVTSPLFARLEAAPDRQYAEPPGEIRPLITALAAAGLWSVRVELPPAPAAEPLRKLLRAQQFQLGTERLLRTL